MRAEERIAQLEVQLAAERAEKTEIQAELAALRQQMQQMLAYVAELEKRLAKDSHNRWEDVASFRYRFLGRRPLVSVGAGVVMGWDGTLVDVVSPGDRAPFVLPSTETRATTRVPSPHPNLSRPYGDAAVLNTSGGRCHCHNANWASQ
jgi:uncharacterized coiled-coil protein SlyX